MVARAFNVIAREAPPALKGCLYWCFKRRAGLRDQAGPSKLDVLVSAISIKRFTGMFWYEVDEAIGLLVRGLGVDHAVAIP